MEQLTEEKGFDWKGAKMEVIRAGAQWKEEILRFADRIFGKDVQPGGFAELIPDVYGPEAACDGNHLLVVEDGRIRALLLTEPISFVSRRRDSERNRRRNGERCRRREREEGSCSFS